MKNKSFKFIVSIMLCAMFASTALIPVELFAATAKTTIAKKSPVKKKVVKKKKATVNLNPPLITPDTAPHSPKPVKAKKKVVKKKAVVTKKKS